MRSRPEILVHHTVYHQVPGRQPTGVVRRYSRVQQSDEPPFVQPSMILTREWCPILCETITEAGLITIINEEGTFLHTIPTEQEREEMSKRTVEVSLRGDGRPDLYIPCGEVHSFSPMKDLRTIRLRSGSDRTACWIEVLPK